MKVTAGDNLVLFREDCRIVGHGVDLGQQHTRDIADRIFRRPMYLRDATERIRVLHMLLRPADQFAALQYLTESVARLDLSRMRTHLLDAIHKRIDPSVESLERQSGDQIRPLRYGKSAHQSKHPVGTHKLRAVQQRQALFTLQFDWLPGKLVQDADRLPFLSFIINIPHSDKRKE